MSGIAVHEIGITLARRRPVSWAIDEVWRFARRAVRHSPQSFWNLCVSGNESKLASRPNFRSAGGMAADAFGIRLQRPQEIE
jgi:hypothetical protein